MINDSLHVQHFQALAELQGKGVFSYGGRTSEAKTKFISGECAMMTESSGGLGDIVKSGVEFGTGKLPYYPEAEGAPQNTGRRQPVGVRRPRRRGLSGVARFFAVLSQTPVQVRPHEESGYLPVTMAAYEATKASGFYDQNPGREIPILQMIAKAPTENSRGIRLFNLPQVRDIINEELERMLNGEQDAKAALDRAVERGNAAIKEAAAIAG